MVKKINRDRYINYLPNNIFFLRKIHNLTQEDLANKFGYSNKTISGWESGRRTPDPFDFQELSKIFNINMDDLVKRDLEAEYYNIKKYSKEEVKHQVSNIVNNSVLEEQKKSAIISITELACTEEGEKREI